MQKVLLINVTKSLVPGITEHLASHAIDVEVVAWGGITITTDDIIAQGISLTDYDLVVLGSRYIKLDQPIGDQTKVDVSELYSVTTTFLRAKNIKYFTFSLPTFFASKVSLLRLVNQTSIKQIPTTVFSTHLQLLDYISNNPLLLPLVIKHPDQDRGRGVILAEDLSAAKDFLSHNLTQQIMITQSVIPNDGDYRLFIIKGSVLGVMKRTTGSEEEFRNNISLGGTGELVTLPDWLIQECSQLAQQLECDVQGMDLIQDKHTGVYYLMEINTNPQYKGFQEASGLTIAIEIAKTLHKMLQ
jgi:RimK-like ATP-grasp domain